MTSLATPAHATTASKTRAFPTRLVALGAAYAVALLGLSMTVLAIATHNVVTFSDLAPAAVALLIEIGIYRDSRRNR